MFDEIAEVKDAIKNNRFEISLNNVHIESVTEAANLAQKRVFERMPQLNLLKLTSCSLSNISSSLQLCENLTNLVLSKNNLTSLPDIFDKFDKMKFLDVTHNEITSLPASISTLEKLETLNVSNNKLTQESFPDLSKLALLHVFIASHNQMTAFPPSLTDSGLSAKLHTLDLSNNLIEEIPESLSNLKQVKDLTMNNNKLKQIPIALAELPKLKVLNLSENLFQDTRFRKLANDLRAKVPSVIAYIAKNGKSAKQGGSKKEKSQKNEDDEADTEENEEKGEVLVVKTGNESLTVKRHPSVAESRPYLVCCVFNNVNLNGDALKNFISLQTKLHSSAFCDNRALSAIGTHRLDAFHLPVCYMALPKDDIHIRALNKKSSITATELLNSLMRDAELARKRSKRSSLDPLHRYLHIVEKNATLACLVDAQQTVISLPPITNSDSTKLTVDTTRIWVEVSSKVSLEACKATMDELVTASRLLFPDLSLDQVRVVENENLVSIYPDKNDLPNMKLERVSASSSSA